MPISNNIYAGTESKWGLIGRTSGVTLGETTFGTAHLDTYDAEQLEGPIPGGIDFGMFRDAAMKNDGGRVLQSATKYYSESNGTRVIPFSDLIVRRKDLGVLLYAVLQNCAEDATAGQFNKVYTIDETTTQPQFSNDAGFFLTVGIYDPAASHMLKFTSCILRSLTLSADFLGGDSRLRASGEFISGFANDATPNFSGTWAYNTQNYFDMGSPSVKQIGGVDVVIYGFSITFTNNAVRAGNAAGAAELYVLPSYDISGEITTKYDPNVQGLRADSLDGTGAKIQLAVSTATTPGYFDISLDECFLGDVTSNYGDEVGFNQTFPFQARRKAAADLAIITVCDNNDRGW